MGSPRKIRPKYRGPLHPWNRIRIDQERILKKEYGLTNKSEIWKAESKLRKLSGQVKKLIRERGKENKQSQLEEKQLLESLFKSNLILENATLENVLGLEVKDLLSRRLQTMVFKRGLSLTPKQARQFVIHGHIFINGKKITIPSYSVTRDEEFLITFSTKSSLSNENHAERIKKEKIKQILKDKTDKQKIEEVVEITEEELKKIEQMVGTVEV